ncbi:MAG TPA: chemotaxis protein CheW [Phototrophicaceae bacterium]|jgi:purine-binding chemotaxis protein CheW|nr:chemotaxis protein CheW [Phototrophicaceae bacterium]
MMTERDDTQPIDWRSIRENLDWDTGHQENMRLLERAVRYAAPLRHESLESADESWSVLTFALGDEQYSVNVMNVRMVRLLPKITPVPNVPRFYPGVVNLRGQILTVFDLRQFFNLGTMDTSPARELVIIQAHNLELGLLATHVYGVQQILRQQIQPVEYIQYAHGVTAERLVVLDIEALSEDERLIIGGQED